MVALSLFTKYVLEVTPGRPTEGRMAFPRGLSFDGVAVKKASTSLALFAAAGGARNWGS